MSSRRPAEGISEAVAVCVVTYNSAADLPALFRSVAMLQHRPLEFVVVDCASADGSAAAARRLAEEGALDRAGVSVRTEALAENRGFAGGMNAALALTRAPWVLSLNADADPAPDYLERLLTRAGAHPELRMGALTGRLLREPVREPEDAEVAAGGRDYLDACGMRLTIAWRHLDRGSGELDRGQYSRPERVFGATGAASLFLRQALDDVAVGGEIFDAAFHSFREDAELAFRLRERGWEILYEPAARVVHRRFNLPERRRRMSAEVNRHSLKNRYLLRAYHLAGNAWLQTLAPTLIRDLGALAYVLLFERSSLGAYRWLWQHRREILARRRVLQGRRTVAPAELNRWFRRDGLSLESPQETKN